MSKRTRAATRPIPEELRRPFYLAAWDLAWSGHFYRHVPHEADQFLQRFGSGSLVARRHGLTILWLTAMAGRFNELARLRLTDVDAMAHAVTVKRSKRGATHAICVDRELVECTAAWHRRLASEAAVAEVRKTTRIKWAEAMAGSLYLLPNVSGDRINVNVFNRDVAGPLGQLFGLRLSSHCFRDTACQEAMKAVKRDAQLDVRAVQALMGHRSARTTEIYLRKQESNQLRLQLFTK